MWEIKPYYKENKFEWDEFVASSRNSTFLFKRDYMEYHSHRYTDHSLMAYRKGKLAAVLPANICKDVLYSHQGLTYGGWVLPPKGIDAGEIRSMWLAWMRYCKENEIVSVVYKPLPYIYALRPSQEDLYMLFLSNAVPVRTDISTAVDLSSNPGFNKLQRRHLKKNSGDFVYEVIQAGNKRGIEEFHGILSRCLQERHDAVPVHSVDELDYLMSRFPINIMIWSAYKPNRKDMLAGVVVYLTEMCIHCQYIATTEEGRTEDILAPLFYEMISWYTKEGYRYFDFGISNENEGRTLNTGLNRQKTSFGGSGVAYQRYEINVPSALKSLSTEL